MKFLVVSLFLFVFLTFTDKFTYTWATLCSASATCFSN